MTGPDAAWIHADAHVHLYPVFDTGRLLAAALARQRALGGPLLLLLSESSGDEVFAQLRTGTHTPPGMRIERTRETRSLAARPVSGAADAVHLVAGRQLVSLEGIEVLALGLEPGHALAASPDRSRPARELLLGALEAGAAAVLPWGVGKWRGPRGRSVAALAADAALRACPLFFLGDVAQRSWPIPTPRAFRGARVLPGSDVLPVAGCEGRVARYGFRIRARFDPERPAGSLLDALRAGARPEPSGRRESLLSTLREQLRYHLARRRPGRTVHPGPPLPIE